MSKSMAGKTLDGVVRVSRTGDRDKLRSPEQQAKDIRRYITKELGAGVGVIHVAIDQTGRKRTGHPKVELAKQRALDGVTDGFAAAYVSRFTRNTRYGLETVDDLLDAGRFFGSPDCPFDLRTPEGRRYLTDKLNEAQYEGDVKAAQFARGVEESIEDGVHLGEPYGYRKSDGPGSPLAPVKAEAKQVHRAFTLRARGLSWTAIADQLNASGASPRPYKRHGATAQAVWTHKTARQLVVGRGPQGAWSVYLGVAFNGTHMTENAHPAIIDAELFARANDTLGTKFVNPDGEAAPHLLRSLVFCSACGYRMTYNGAYLRCRFAQHGAGKCPKPASCPAAELEQMVWERFEAEHLDEDSAATPLEDINGQVQAAQDRVIEAKRVAGRARKLFLLADTPDDEQEAEREVRAAQDEQHAAEWALLEAKAAARRSRLPVDLGLAEARRASVIDRNVWLSLVYGAVIVRQGRGWREPVIDRSVVLDKDAVPSDPTVLRGFITAQAN